MEMSGMSEIIHPNGNAIEEPSISNSSSLLTEQRIGSWSAQHYSGTSYVNDNEIPSNVEAMRDAPSQMYNCSQPLYVDDGKYHLGRY